MLHARNLRALHLVRCGSLPRWLRACLALRRIALCVVLVAVGVVAAGYRLPALLKFAADDGNLNLAGGEGPVASSMALLVIAANASSLTVA